MKVTVKSVVLFVLIALCLVSLGSAVGEPISVADALDSARQRLAGTYTLEQLNAMTPETVTAELTDAERVALGTAHIRFIVNVPVRVYVLHDKRFGEPVPSEPFWIQERGFESTGLEVLCDGEPFVAYARDFEAGLVGLGVNSFSGDYLHYFVAVKAAREGEVLEITNLQPACLQTTVFEEGAKPYPLPDWDPLERVPEELAGATLVQVDIAWRRTTRLLDYFTETEYPATAQADNIVLTWSGCPKTTQGIQWRTSVETTKGAVAYLNTADHNTFTPGTPTIVAAESTLVKTPGVLNQPELYTHTATLTDLEPGTTYVYAVGDGTENGWTELAEFTTAPETPEPFSFVYMGDVQLGFPRWESLLERAFRERPDAAFYLLAGDNVNRGNDRNEWDALFHHARDVFDRRVVVPAVGNHEYHGGPPDLYRAMFHLRENGPESVPAKQAYSFEYGNALFVVLDSNLPPETHTEWLDTTLGDSDAVWKFVMMHHPLYSSGPGRDNVWLRDAWLPVFDRHHVDLVLQGHDHAYLRTGPMKADMPVESPAEGTIYVVSVSGTKLYDQSEHSYTAVGFVDTPTYQVLDIQLGGHRLTYRAYDIDGNVKDEFVKEK